MKILLIGDVVGRSGREAVARHLPVLRKELSLDFVVLNGENAAHGFGILPDMCEQFFALGADVVTTGNHAWDQKEIIPYIQKERRLLRPMNLPAAAPGKGEGVFQTATGKNVLVLHPMGQVHLKESPDNPFAAVEKALEHHKLGGNVDAILVDLHAEATSEKYAMGHFLDGRVSAVVGTHTHVPTADTWIFPKGTAYQTDLGMCGDYYSVIGMDPEIPLKSFTTTIRAGRMEPATGEATFCGLYVETDDKTGLAVKAMPVRRGGRLMPAAL